MPDLRSLPSVDVLLTMAESSELLAEYGRLLSLEAFRSVLDEIRRTAIANSDRQKYKLPEPSEILMMAEDYLRSHYQPTLEMVLNATGVILHTNLGRAPLSQEAIQAVTSIAPAYSTLEFNLKTGKRGSRLIHAESLLTRLTGAEAALVVNNNASAVMLALSALANRRKVIISRTQLIEIGGGFRVPDVMKQSGARLVEVGTTNRVHLADYESALQNPTALILRAHHSNFRLVGFTSEPSLKELDDISSKYSVPLVEDLGSGALIDTGQFGLAREPLVQESIQAGVDLVCFSGDKLLGGPQAGILIGRADIVAKLKKHPLARAIRADKLCLSALSATLLHYLKDEAVEKIPVWRMIAMPLDSIRSRVQNWRDSLGYGEIVSSHSTIGGGSMPGEELPTFALAFTGMKPDAFLAKLRKAPVPVIARIEQDRILFDPRTILPEQDPVFLPILKQVLGGR